MDKDIIEGNKLIAEFMGVKFDKMDFTGDRSLGGNADAVRYHRDWSWLMPVVEKIQKLGFRVEIDMGTIDTNVHITKGDERLNIAYYSNSKECVYTAVIQFIQWYNQQNK